MGLAVAVAGDSEDDVWFGVTQTVVNRLARVQVVGIAEEEQPLLQAVDMSRPLEVQEINEREALRDKM